MVRQQDWTQLSDEELARHCAAQLTGCLDELVRRYEGTIRECARRMALNPDDAEDAAQEIFLRLVSALPRFEGRSAFATWLYRLAHNACVDTFRRQVRARRTRVAPQDDDQEATAELVADWGEPATVLDDRIQECYLGWVVSQLPPDYQDVIRLRLAEGRSTAETARALGVSVDAVKSKLKRARQRLREDLATRRSCPYCSPLGSFRADPARGLE